MARRGVHGKRFDHVAHLIAWSASIEDYLDGVAVDRGLPLVAQMTPERGVAWLYYQLVCTVSGDANALAGKLSGIIERVRQHLTDPFILTEETFGTGDAAVAAQQAWERRFPTVLPSRPPESRSGGQAVT